MTSRTIYPTFRCTDTIIARECTTRIFYLGKVGSCGTRRRNRRNDRIDSQRARGICVFGTLDNFMGRSLLSLSPASKRTLYEEAVGGSRSIRADMTHQKWDQIFKNYRVLSNTG